MIEFAIGATLLAAAGWAADRLQKSRRESEEERHYREAKAREQGRQDARKN